MTDDNNVDRKLGECLSDITLTKSLVVMKGWNVLFHFTTCIRLHNVDLMTPPLPLTDFEEKKQSLDLFVLHFLMDFSTKGLYRALVNISLRKSAWIHLTSSPGSAEVQVKVTGNPSPVLVSFSISLQRGDLTPDHHFWGKLKLPLVPKPISLSALIWFNYVGALPWWPPIPWGWWSINMIIDYLHITSRDLSAALSRSFTKNNYSTAASLTPVFPAGFNIITTF